MEELTVNNRFKLSCPEGFREMTEKEQKKLNMLGGGEALFLTSEEGHMVVSIGWKEVNAFAGLLLHMIRPVASVEANVSRAMAPYEYRKETALTRKIGGQAAEGFRYTYTAGDMPMAGESYVLRQGRMLTFFHVYLRDALREESLRQWNALLDAVEPL